MYEVRISAVRYSNTYPLLYGLLNSGIELNASIDIDHPADCAKKVINGEADIGLVPVVTIPSNPGLSIIGDFCIGSKGPVRTVLLLSNRPLKEIDTIYLDYRSRTSVALTRLLSQAFWGCNCEYRNTSPDFNFHGLSDNEGLVLIGDQCYDMESVYSYRTDLATEWHKFTGMPFVFACWVSNKSFSENFIDRFNKAQSYGVRNLEKVVRHFGEKGSMSPDILRDYLTNNIDYILDKEKIVAMNTFFKYLEEINEI